MNSSASGPARPILNWNVVQLKSSWGVLILIGGGYAIADASNSSGFSDWVAEGLAGLVEGWEPWTVCLLCSTMAALFTEITSNSASCALFVPLLDKLVSFQKFLFLADTDFFVILGVENLRSSSLFNITSLYCMLNVIYAARCNTTKCHCFWNWSSSHYRYSKSSPNCDQPLFI